MLTLTRNNLFFYLIVFTIAIIIVLLSNPFLRYPYDIFAHLIAIDEMYHGQSITTTTIQHKRLIWHTAWADIFKLFHINSTEILLRAKIIFSVQTSIALLSIYYFSHVIIRNIFQDIQKETLRYLALWSTLIWFTIFATSSVYYHLIWNLWYSVNYQITLPLFFYITALTLTLFLESTSIKQKILYVIIILVVSRFILQVHPMEFMYYLMYVLTLGLIYSKQLFIMAKKYYYIFILGIGSFIYFIKFFQSESSKIFNYLTLENFPKLYDIIMQTGEHIIAKLNRADAGSINELMYLIYYFMLFTLLHMLVAYYRKQLNINIKVFIVLLFTSMFIFIPLYQFTGGFFALIARQDVVHRIYYSSSLFVLLPVLIYYLSQYYHLKLKYINLTLASLLIATYLFSKYAEMASHHYYYNIQSIANSLTTQKYDFLLNQQQIDLIGKNLKKYEEKPYSKKINLYYARTDIAFVIKYIYQREVYWESRRANPNYTKHYQEDTVSNKYRKILFETPTTFPKYIPYL